MEVSEFLAKVRPLDLLVYRGGDGVSGLILSLEKKYAHRADVSHVEIAMNHTMCPLIDSQAARGGNMMAWGSTMSGSLNDGVNNAETGKSFFGVQFRELGLEAHAALKMKSGNIGVARLKDSPMVQRDNEPDAAYRERMSDLRIALVSAYNRYKGRGYDANPLSLIGAIVPRARGIRACFDACLPKRATSLLFCSEFVASLYIDLGIINDATDGVIDGKTLDPKNVVPVDFIGGDSDSDGIRVSLYEDIIWLK